MKLIISSQAPAKIMTRQQMLKSQSNYEEILRCFSGIGCFDEMFSLQVKPDSKLFQVPTRCVAYALQKPVKEELE